MSVRHRIDHPLPARCSAVAPGHVGGRARLIQEHEAAGIHEALPHAKAAALLGYIRPVLLGRPERLFLCVRSMRLSIR